MASGTQGARGGGLIAWAKDNRFLSLLVLAGSVIGAGGTLVTNASKVYSFFSPSEHIVVVANHLSAEAVRKTNVGASYKIKLEPQNGQQRLQRITLLPPSERTLFSLNENANLFLNDSLTVIPPFEVDVGVYLVEIDSKVNDQLPLLSSLDASHAFDYWECRDSLPIALTINYLTSSGALQTEKQLYGMDFVYRTQRACEDCGFKQFWVYVSNFRFVRRLGRSEDPVSVVAAETAQAKKRFHLSTWRAYEKLDKDGAPPLRDLNDR
jgi:hypothetical protein